MYSRFFQGQMAMRYIADSFKEKIAIKYITDFSVKKYCRIFPKKNSYQFSIAVFSKKKKNYQLHSRFFQGKKIHLLSKCLTDSLDKEVIFFSEIDSL